MTPERWQQVRTLFDRAVELAPPERAAFLQGACAGDAELRSEVGALLDANTAAGSFLETPPMEQMREALENSETGPVRSRVGPYEIAEELGHGGMGTVYLAHRSDGDFRQTVALKLVRRGMDTDFILRRFRGERQILAALEHPNIARLLDGGSTEDGLPYLVMEYVAGQHLLEDCDARALPVRERLELFRQVCAAVAYAHRHLVVHRDIKPSNILLTDEGVPKLLDFGVAKLLQPDVSEEPVERTETALRFLTPEYASPEQVRGEPVTTASDIYSLGVVLYELLTGRRPYRTTGRPPDVVARAVCEEEPARPSATVPALKGDLDNILLMALRKEPDRRYASVEQFSEDIRRHLEGRPVRARRDTLGYRSGKFLSRHRFGVAAAATAFAMLVGAAAVAIQQARIARAERAAAEQHFNEVRELADSFLFEFHDAIKDLPGSTPARRLVVRRALEYLEKLSGVRTDDPDLRRDLATAYERIARVQGGLFESHLGDTNGARESLAKALAIRETLLRLQPASRADRVSLAETYLQLSEVLMLTGDPAAAITRARVAVSQLALAAGAAPADRTLEARLARARRYLGLALARGGSRGEALATLRMAAGTFEALSGAEPANAAYRRELGITHQHILHALAGSPDRDAAFGSYERAVALQRSLAEADPGNFQLRRELAYTHVDMGSFLEWSGDGKSALEYYRRALPILEGLVAADPRNADARLLLAETCNSVGYAEALAGQISLAFQDLEKSLRLFEAITPADPANARARLGLARLYESFGTVWDAAASTKGADSDRDGARRKALDWYRKSRTAYRDLQSHGPLDPQAARELEAVTRKIAAFPAG